MKNKLIKVKCHLCGNKGYGYKEKDAKFLCPRCIEIIKYNVNERLKSIHDTPREEE
jgi:ribosomal protein S27E